MVHEHGRKLRQIDYQDLEGMKPMQPGCVSVGKRIGFRQPSNGSVLWNEHLVYSWKSGGRGSFIAPVYEQRPILPSR